MELIEEGKKVPEFFFYQCLRYMGEGCGAKMKVEPSDCFILYENKGMAVLSFFCGHCGRVCTPDNDLLDVRDLSEKQRGQINERTGLPDWPEKVDHGSNRNTPPWWADKEKFDGIDKYCEKNGIKWGFRPG